MSSIRDGSKPIDGKKQLRVAAYIRVSTEDQATKFGPDMQKEAIRSYIKAKGQLDDGVDKMVLDETAHIYEDRISGTTKLKERPGFAQLIEDIENAPQGRMPFDVVAVYKIDRFARRLKILLEVIEFLEKHNIQFVSVNESIDTSTPFGRAILGIMGVIAELEIETTKTRIQGGIKSAMMTGVFMSVAPFGYVKDANKRLIVHSEEAQLVTQIYNWFVFDGLSTQDIATRLTQESILSPDASAVQNHKRKGNVRKVNGVTFWRAEKIRAILRNEVYLGLYYGNKTKDKKHIPREEWILSDYRHEPIIEKHLFIKAQEKLAASASKAISRKADERQYLLRSLIKCGYCREKENEMLTWHGLEKIKDGKVSYFYCCGGKTTAKHDVICPTLPIPGDQLEEYIVNFVRSLLIDPQSTYKYQLKLKSNKVRVKVLKEESERLRKSLNLIPIRKQNLSEQQEIGVIGIEELDERMKKVEADELQMAKRMAEIDQVLGQQALSEGYTRSFTEFAQRYSQALEDAFNNFDDIYVLLHALIDKIIIYSRPVNHQFDKIAGKKKEGQQMPHEIKIELKLPQEIIASLVERKFAPKTGVV